MAYTPYQKKNPGDVLKLQEWLEIQQRIKEELRDHRHRGQDGTGDVSMEHIGPLLGSTAFEPGAVTAGKLAKKSIGELALAPGAIKGKHIHQDSRLPESLIFFRSTGGHDHDGIVSRALPADAVGTAQLQDQCISEGHLEVAPADADLTPDEETYARGRAFTPGNVLRAARQLIDHTDMKSRPLLVASGYEAIEGTSIVIRGFLLDKLLESSSDGADSVLVEFNLLGQRETRPAQILDTGRVRAAVPSMGTAIGDGYLRIVTSTATTTIPRKPITNGVAFKYKPAT